MLMSKRKKPNPEEYCIYAIDNLANGKRYIGQTQDLKWRITTHKGKLKLNTHPNNKLQEDWNKYGEGVFKFSVIEYCDRNKGNEREMYYISFFDTVNTGYNISIGGTNGNNFPRKRIKQYDLNGKFIRIWESAAEAARFYNVKRTNITHAVKKHCKTLDSQWCYEDEEIDGYYLKKGQFPLAQYDSENNLINVYKHLRDVIEKNKGFSKCNILDSMSGHWRKTAYGYTWKKIRKEEYYELCERLAKCS